MSGKQCRKFSFPQSNHFTLHFHMSNVSLVSCVVQNKEGHFLDDFIFEIAFNCVEPLPDDLDWKLTYLGSATDSTHDQVLDSILLGPVQVGINKFVFQTPGPDPEKIPKSEQILGATGIIISCSYRDQEFLTIGYYVNNELEGQKKEMETVEDLPPAKRVKPSPKDDEDADEIFDQMPSEEQSEEQNKSIDEDQQDLNITDENGVSSEDEKPEEKETNDQPINLEEECLEGEIKETLEVIPREKLDLKKVVRLILDNPRVTPKEIKWD